jgi:hypothetical protein
MAEKHIEEFITDRLGGSRVEKVGERCQANAVYVVNVYSVLDEEPRDFNVAVKECSGKQFSSTKSAYLPDFAALRYADSRMI